MNKILDSLKRFFKNKNTVTIIGVILVLVLLYWGYSSQIKKSVTPVTIPVAKVTIPPRTQITNDMIAEVSVSSIAVSENVYRTRNILIGKYTNVNTIVPKGSMFYQEAVVNETDFKDSIFDDLEEGKIPYLFSVSMESSYGNSIYPKDTVDIYMKAIDENGKIVVGKLLEDVTVLAVRDSSGNDVFQDMANIKTPSYFVFSLSEEIHILMRKAAYISTNSIELFPVPHGRTYVSEGETRVSTEYLKDFINSKSVILEGQESSTEEDIEDTTEGNVEDTQETTKE